MAPEFGQSENNLDKKTDEPKQELDQVESLLISSELAAGGNDNDKNNLPSILSRADRGSRARAVQRMQSQHGNSFTSRQLAVQRQPSYTAGSLPSPSYVNGSPSSNLTGGGTASAGDSYFVTGGQKGQLLDRVMKIRTAYKAVDEAAKKMQKEGEGGWFGIGSDDQVLTTAKNLQGTADGMLKIADAIDSWTGSPNKAAIEKGSKAVEYADNLIHAAELVGSIKKLNTTSEKLSDKPNQADVEAWADSVGDAFDKAGGMIGLIPSEGLPGFITDYYKGLLSAPKNYINAFKTIMHARYDKIDMEAGIGSANVAAWEPGKGNVWEGDMSGVFIGAYFQPKAADGSTLQELMTRHRKDLGVDLYKTNKEIAKALLQGPISSEAPEDVRVTWSSYIASS